MPSQQRVSLPRPTATRYKSHDTWTMHNLVTPRTYQGHKFRRMAVTVIFAVSLTVSALVFQSWVISSLQSSPPQPSMTEIYIQSYSSRVLIPQPAEELAQYHFGTPAVELGALIGFLSAFASNSLPENVDPGRPLDPDVILGFHPRGSHPEDDVLSSVEDAWIHNPVVLFTDVHRGNPPASRELKGIFNAYNLSPEPTIFDIDERVDEDVLRPLLQRITGATSFPFAIVGGRPILSLNELRDMRDSGKLQERLASAGAVVNGKKVKRGRKH